VEEWKRKRKKVIAKHRDSDCPVGAAGGAETSTMTVVNPRLVNAPNTRPSWDEHFLFIAEAVSGRADCRRRKVGAVVVKENRIKSTGYNGSPPGGKSCLAGQCPRGLKSKAEVVPGSSYDTGAGSCIALHAEQNALLYASPDDRKGATLYLTDQPCEGCWRMIQGSGIARVVYGIADVYVTLEV
jgi:dCMP deaminase